MPDTRSQLIQDKDFLANLARAYLEGGQLAKARSRFTLYVRLFPRELRGYNGLGEVAFREDDYERAVQLFAQSLKLYGDQPEVASRLTEISEKALARSTGSGQAPSTGSGQAPSTGSGQAPSTGSGQAPSTGSGQAGSTSSGQALADRIQWVLASYLEPREKRPGMPAVDPFAPTPAPASQQLPIPTREPAVELPKAPVPDLD